MIDSGSLKADVLEPDETAEDVFRTMANAAPVLLWMAGLDALCNFFNQTWLDFTGRTMQQEMGVGWTEGVHPEDFERCMTTYMDSFRERRTFEMVYRLRRHDGEYRWILDRGTPRYGRTKDFTGYIGSCIDITERYDREEQLAQSLREKEVLLAELHHRVKNNLQVISSLIDMQARRLERGASREALDKCHSRIETIALIHEQLYQTGDYSRVPFSEYARRLATNVFEAARVTGANVSLVMNIDDLSLAVDKAIPCGLILNELITNALKHAFPADRNGTVRIELRQVRTRVLLAVADDGVGIPDGADAGKVDSLGTQLVATLVEQLNGQIEIVRDAGTNCRITFPVESVP